MENGRANNQHREEEMVTEFEVDRQRYSDLTNGLEKINSPDPRNIELELLKDTFDWERNRFTLLDEYAGQGFK